MRGSIFWAASVTSLHLLVGSAWAGEACLPEIQRLAPASIEAFKADPKAMLARFSSGGTGLARQVRNLVGSDTDLAGVFLSLLTSATNDQKAALGAGLSQAAQACVRGAHADAARLIQEQIVRAKDDSVFAAFVSASNAVETSALGVLSSSLFSGVAALSDGTETQSSGNFGDPGGGSSFVLNRSVSFSASGAGGSSVNITRNASPSQ